MPTYTIRPNTVNSGAGATSFVTSKTQAGSTTTPNLTTAINDNSDSSYVTPTSSTASMVLNMGDISLATGEYVASATLHVRASGTSGGTVSVSAADGLTRGSSGFGVSGSIVTNQFAMTVSTGTASETNTTRVSISLANNSQRIYDVWIVVDTQYYTPTCSVNPVLSGTPAVGSTLSCTSGTWSNASSYTYLFQVNGITVQNTASNTYVVQPADAGKSVVTIVTASNTGASNSASSNTLTIASANPIRMII